MFKRIAQLASLKKLVLKLKSKPYDFPFQKPIRILGGRRMIAIDEWTALYDYILADMVIEYGFGNWKKILTAHNWYRADCPIFQQQTLKLKYR